jgi:GNAT superfamily N-acetyltransferase
MADSMFPFSRRRRPGAAAIAHPGLRFDAMMRWVEIRPYEPSDLEACRDLYTQLVEHHREIYDDPSIGGDDPGAGFDDYLALSERVATWVAVDDNSIVGLTGLLWKEGESTVEPVIVARDRRRAGIGRSLLETAIDESRCRGAIDVNIKPVARNASAIKAFHELGSARSVISSCS